MPWWSSSCHGWASSRDPHRRALGLRNVVTARPELRIHNLGGLRVALSPFALFGVAGPATVPSGEWAAGVILLLIVGQLLAGVGEELVCGGFLPVRARTRTPTWARCCSPAWCLTLIHGVSVLTGQALGPTLAQLILGRHPRRVFYLLRRASGLLVIPMLVHGPN